jgi:ABC-type multidrug transport system ATPase subunit
VLWTTQRVDEVPGFAHAVTMLVSGRVVFNGSPAQLSAQAASDRYLVQVRARHSGDSPSAAAVRLAVGPHASIVATNDVGHFVLAPREPSGLGIAVAHLVKNGFEVIGCRQAHSEIEDAFMVLTEAAA